MRLQDRKQTMSQPVTIDQLAGWIEKHVNVGRYWKIVGKTRQMEIEPDDLKEGGAA